MFIKMAREKSVNGLLTALLCSGLAVAAERPAPVATLDLNGQWPGPVATSLAFASEDTIAIARYSGSDTVSRFIITIDWQGTKLQPLKSKSLPIYGGGGRFEHIYGVSNGRILSAVAPNPQLWSRDLNKLEDTPIKVLNPPTPQSGMAADWVNVNEWNLYRLGPSTSFVRAGRGEILSVSDAFIAVRGDRDLLRIEDSTSGVVAGSFQIPSRSVCAGTVTILGTDRLMLTGCKGEARVLDFTGKERMVLPRGDGWGFRYGASADGGRVLFDNFTRRISTSQRISEFVESLVTLGMGPNIESKGEEIRVVDTKTGAICFDLDSPERQFGVAGQHHADLSPSGRYVAVVDASELRVYMLPASCAAQWPSDRTR
jgi:hypothetical protein